MFLLWFQPLGTAPWKPCKRASGVWRCDGDAGAARGSGGFLYPPSEPKLSRSIHVKKSLVFFFCILLKALLFSNAKAERLFLVPCLLPRSPTISHLDASPRPRPRLCLSPSPPMLWTLTFPPNPAPLTPISSDNRPFFASVPRFPYQTANSERKAQGERGEGVGYYGHSGEQARRREERARCLLAARGP